MPTSETIKRLLDVRILWEGKETKNKEWGNAKRDRIGINENCLTGNKGSIEKIHRHLTPQIQGVKCTTFRRIKRQGNTKTGLWWSETFKECISDQLYSFYKSISTDTKLRLNFVCAEEGALLSIKREMMSAVSPYLKIHQRIKQRKCGTISAIYSWHSRQGAT